MKNILYRLWMLLFLFACSEAEQVEYSKLSIDFEKSKVDVGENSEILEIPVVLSGCRTDIPLQVVVQILTTDGEAIAGVDYELIDTKLVFDACGKSSLKVKIIDNEEITKDIKTFSISMKAENPEVASGISNIKVYIVSDDVENISPFVGHYTLTAQDFSEDTKLSSALGGIEIVQDPDDATKYYMLHMALKNGEEVLPLTMGDNLYFTVDGNGNMTMPVLLNIGDYGGGIGISIGLTSEGYTTDDPIKIEQVGNRLIFKGDGLAGIVIEEDEITSIYYALKNIVLEKINK